MPITPPLNIAYKIAVLCYLYDAEGRLLLLHRAKNPNAGMYSPIGGKLEMQDGEGPHECAVREIAEEAGLEIPPSEVRMLGIVSERAYEGENHWLIFLFEVTRPIEHEEISLMEIVEGNLEWVDPASMETVNIPYTDRHIMWPLVQQHRGGFFVVHIDCAVDPICWTVHESVPGAALAKD